ncbi:hypothetical protein BGLA2_990125 [Burkholderia gladioli]|nr:hypothetical protein BGLA2_990125 [Burkholderia gladioli]
MIGSDRHGAGRLPAAGPVQVTPLAGGAQCPPSRPRILPSPARQGRPACRARFFPPPLSCMKQYLA